jgi:hypothetical protein
MHAESGAGMHLDTPGRFREIAGHVPVRNRVFDKTYRQGRGVILPSALVLQQIRLRAPKQFDAHLPGPRFETSFHFFPSRRLSWIIAIRGETVIEELDEIVTHRKFVLALHAELYCEVAQEFLLFG